MSAVTQHIRAVVPNIRAVVPTLWPRPATLACGRGWRVGHLLGSAAGKRQDDGSRRCHRAARRRRRHFCRACPRRRVQHV